MKRIYAIEAWCINCRRCEVACKTFHSKSRETFKALMWEKPTPRNRVRVEGNRTLSIAINCRHCTDPKCVQACISGAMTKNPQTGVVTSNPEKCVGCRSCVSMCPFGAVRIEDWGGRALAFKCDLCGEELGQPGNPSCVAACPNRALIYVDTENDDVAYVAGMKAKKGTGVRETTAAEANSSASVAAAAKAKQTAGAAGVAKTKQALAKAEGGQNV